MDVSKLEPAENNPKKNAITMIVLLVVAFAAGGIIINNYMATRKRQAEEVAAGRSPEIGELVKNYSYKNRENKNASFFDCTGQVTLMACFSIHQMEDSKVVFETLKQFEERYKDNDKVKILLLSMDSEADVPMSQVIPVLEKHDLAGEKFDVVASNGEQFLAYLKNQVKFIYLSKDKKDGKWIVPQQIRIVAPDLQLRGKEDEYDFSKYLKMEAKAKEEIAQRIADGDSNTKAVLDEKYEGDINKLDGTIVEHARAVMVNSVDWMLANEKFDKVKIDASKKENIYKPYLFLFGGFILFLVVLGLKVKRKALVKK